MIYLQSDINKKIPYNFEVACALYGAKDLNRQYKFVTYEEVISGKVDHLIKGNLFVGTVEFMNSVFSRIGLTNVKLPKNSNRKSEIKKLGEVKDKINIFIKPLKLKLFTGFVLDGCKWSILDDIPDDTEVLVYEAFKSKIITEWRVYIDRGKIIDSHCYSGDFKVVPDYNFVEDIILENKALNFPSTYIIDVGVLESSENVIIEYNDAWAIGNYGLNNIDYLRMLGNRYFDIVISSITF